MRLGFVILVAGFFVILNEVKNLTHPTDKILRCAQNDASGYMSKLVATMRITSESKSPSR